MDTAVIIGSILVAVASIFLAFFLSRKKKQAARPEAPPRLLKADINYTQSCVIEAGGIEYVVLHLHITNNYDYDLEDVGIVSSPSHPLAAEVIPDHSMKLANIPQHEIRYESLRPPLRVARGFLLIGNLIYRTTDGTCPVDELRIVTNDHEEVIKVHKELIRKAARDRNLGKDSSWTT